MSREAWGDEGDVPERAEDTAMWQEFCPIRKTVKQWWTDFKSDAPTVELAAKMDALIDLMEEIDDMLLEDLKP